MALPPGGGNPKTPGHEAHTEIELAAPSGCAGEQQPAADSSDTGKVLPARHCQPGFLSPTLGVASFAAKRSLWATAL